VRWGAWVAIFGHLRALNPQFDNNFSI